MDSSSCLHNHASCPAVLWVCIDRGEFAISTHLYPLIITNTKPLLVSVNIHAICALICARWYASKQELHSRPRIDVFFIPLLYSCCIQSGLWGTTDLSGHLVTCPCPPNYCSCHSDFLNAECNYIFNSLAPDDQCHCDREGVLPGT